MNQTALKWGALLALFLALVYLLRPVLSPFLLGALLAYLGDPLVMRLQRWKVSRGWAVVLVFTCLTLSGLIMLLICIPLIGQQVQNLVIRVPAMVEWVQWVLLPLIKMHLGIDLTHLDFDLIVTTLKSSWQNIGDVAADILLRISSSGVAVIGFFGNLALVPVVAFYLLKDWHPLLEKLQLMLPRHVEHGVVKLAGECNEVLAAFLRGQLLVMLSLGVIYSIGLSLVGVPFAVLIGMVAGAANIVPYLGFIIGILLALISALIEFRDWLHPGLVCLVFIVGQALEGTVLTPFLVGDRIGLHPVAVIFAVLAGAQLFGFVGMLLALPVAAVTLVILRYAFRRYLNSELYGTQRSEIQS